MITLSTDAHASWACGTFILELLGAEANPYELRARFQWTPQKSESPKELGIAADPTSIELIPLTFDTRLIDLIAPLPIMDGHIVAFKTNDPINAPVPHWDLLMLQCFLIRVLRMAGRTGEDMFETLDSDNKVSLLTAGFTRSENQPMSLLSHLSTMMKQLI